MPSRVKAEEFPPLLLKECKGEGKTAKEIE